MSKVCLCGSTRFKAEFDKACHQLALRGHVVYSLSMFARQEKDIGKGDAPLITDEDKLVLDAVHMAKILNSDCVLVINPNGYIGESTEREIYFARVLGKPIYALHSDAKINRMRNTNFRSEDRPCPAVLQS